MALTAKQQADKNRQKALQNALAKQQAADAKQKALQNALRKKQAADARAQALQAAMKKKKKKYFSTEIQKIKKKTTLLLPFLPFLPFLLVQPQEQERQ